MSGDNVTHFDSFGVEQKIKKFIVNRNIATNIFRTKAYDSICRYFCIGFIYFMLKGKHFLECTNLFSPNEYEMNNKMILKYFQEIIKRLR